MSIGRSIAQGERKIFPHASCTVRTWASSLLARGFESNVFRSGNQESLENAETTEMGVWGWLCHLQWGSRSTGVPKRIFVRKGCQNLEISHFAAFEHTLLMESSPSCWISSGTKPIYYGLLPIVYKNKIGKQVRCGLVYLALCFFKNGLFYPPSQRDGLQTRDFPYISLYGVTVFRALFSQCSW